MEYQTHTPAKGKKLNRYLGFGYMLAGAFFLFEPYIGIIDLLPDALGYLLICLGLYRLADLDERLSEALKGARSLALVGIARWVAMFLVFGFVSPAEQPVFMLLMLFSLGGLDCILLIPMWKHLGGGLQYLGARSDATAMLDRKKMNGKQGTYNVVEKYTAVTTVFFMLHELLAILPELTVLTHEKGGAELGQGTRYYDFVGLFRGIGILLSLILGIAWLILTIRFVRKLKGDKPFFARVSERYTAEILPRHDMWAMRAVRASMVCLITSAVLSLDFYLDNVNILPDVLAAILLFMAVWFLRPYVGKTAPLFAASAVFGVVSMIPWILQLRKYFVLNDLGDVFRSDKVYARWETAMLWQILSALLFVLAMALLLRTLYGMVKRYTGVRIFRESSSYASERSESIHRHIRRKLVAVMIGTVLVALSTLFHWGIIPYLVELDVTASVGGPAGTVNTVVTLVSMVVQLLVESYWFIDLCVGGVLIAATASAASEISEQMEYSYMMKD